MPDRLAALVQALKNFRETLDATTVPIAGGSRRIDGGFAHTIALDEASSKLYAEMDVARESLNRQYGQMPVVITVRESDSPDGPFTDFEKIVATPIAVGANGADARLVAALDSLDVLIPGGHRIQWKLRDGVTVKFLNAIESAGKLLSLSGNNSSTDTPPPPTPRLTINEAGDVATLDNAPHPITQDASRCLKKLLDAKGLWVTSNEMKAVPGSGERPDKIINKLPTTIRNLIVSQTGKGYRLPPE